MKWFYSNKKAVEVVRNHKAMVSAFFFYHTYYPDFFHVINSSTYTCFIIIF
jgi:hypothetical protein